MYRAKREAFTLIEMMIVLAVIGTLMAFIMPKVMRNWKKSENQTSQLKLGNIKEALMAFKLSANRYPSEQEGLGVLANDEEYKKITKGDKAPFKEQDLLDDKGQPIIYLTGSNIKDKGTYSNYQLLWIGAGTEDDPQLQDGD